MDDRVCQDRHVPPFDSTHSNPDLPLRFRAVGRLLVGDMIESVERVEVEGRLEPVR